ncbi:glycosyl transferase [Bacteroidia bacterium]|nr:glycosyl transferase [Bacteroidia bacterium]
MTEIGELSFKKIILYISIILQTLKSLIAFRPQLCYIALTAKGIAFYKDFIIILLFKLFRRRVILHFHNKGVCQYQNKCLDDRLYRFVFNHSKVILLSNKLYADIQKYVNRKDVFLCPNGISDQVMDNQKTAHSTIQILFLSNMMKAKGVFDLLDACDILNRKGIEFQCNFVGKWADITEVDLNNAIKERKLTCKVLAHGARYGSDKKAFFNEADIFVFPTFYVYETFGLVNLEAMLYGLPIISTNEGGIPDIINNGVTGYIVEKRNSVELAERMEELIKNPELRESMGKAGRQKFQEQYTLERFEKRICEILNANL